VKADDTSSDLYHLSFRLFLWCSFEGFGVQYFILMLNFFLFFCGSYQRLLVSVVRLITC
jgi:hypothetical protein